jgi:glycosyltransferase involved in cell wall biosynthesis/SAM-dependent methyltransferase
MNILLAVHQFFPIHYTGTERMVLNLSKQFQRMGHSVSVLTYGLLEKDGFTKEGNCYIKEYFYETIKVISIRHIKIKNDVSFSVFDKDIEQFCDRFLTREHFDLIHVCHPMRVGSVIRSAKKKMIPVVLTLTDFWLMCPRGIGVTRDMVLCSGSMDGNDCYERCYGEPWKEKISKRFKDVWELFQLVDKVVCATQFLKGMYESQGYCHDISIIRFGTDYNTIIPNSRIYHETSEITFGYLSYLAFHKGAHVLVEAYIKADAPNISLLMYGDTSADKKYFNQLKTIAKNTGKIGFPGKYSYEDLTNIINNLDVIVLPSIWWENSPLVLLRSLAQDVPVITSNLGGMTEIIKDGMNGFSFEIGNPEDLAKIIKKISDNPSILNTLKQQITHPPRIEEESFEYDCLYQSLISLPPAGPDLNLQRREPANSNPPVNNDKTVQVPGTRLGIIPELRTKYGASFVSDIHTSDAMYQFLATHPEIKDPVGEYFRSGESMLATLDEILADQKIEFHSLQSFLDFASGYGRLTRFLTYKLPPDRITICDIDKNAVDFCKDKFGVDGVYSHEDPDDLSILKKYDVIWVASLFSHLSLRVWKKWLKKLSEMLNNGGILVFSTHGCHCFNMLDVSIRQNVIHQDHGFYFIKKSESDSLSHDIYGTTYVTEQFVRHYIKTNHIGIIVGYYPKKLWEFQDIYILRKETPQTEDQM